MRTQITTYSASNETHIFHTPIVDPFHFHQEIQNLVVAQSVNDGQHDSLAVLAVALMLHRDKRLEKRKVPGLDGLLLRLLCREDVIVACDSRVARPVRRLVRAAKKILDLP